jgi:hypothetical protein
MRKKKLQLAHPGKVLLFVTMKKTDELLEKGINELGITPSKQQINNFITYLSELKKWNKANNGCRRWKWCRVSRDTNKDYQARDRYVFS